MIAALVLVVMRLSGHGATGTTAPDVRGLPWIVAQDKGQSLIDRTGRTQCITFRIRPPKKASAAIPASIPAPFRCVAGRKGDAGARASDVVGTEKARVASSVTVILVSSCGT